MRIPYLFFAQTYGSGAILNIRQRRFFYRSISEPTAVL